MSYSSDSEKLLASNSFCCVSLLIQISVLLESCDTCGAEVFDLSKEIQKAVDQCYACRSIRKALKP